jgi:hypothetical protein
MLHMLACKRCSVRFLCRNYLLFQKSWSDVLALQGLVLQLPAACSACMTWLLWTLLQALLWSYCRVSPSLPGEDNIGGIWCTLHGVPSMKCCLSLAEEHGLGIQQCISLYTSLTIKTSS